MLVKYLLWNSSAFARSTPTPTKLSLLILHVGVVRIYTTTQTYVYRLLVLGSEQARASRRPHDQTLL